MDKCTLLRLPMIDTYSPINIKQWSVKLIWPVESEFCLKLQISCEEEWLSTHVIYIHRFNDLIQNLPKEAPPGGRGRRSTEGGAAGTAIIDPQGGRRGGGAQTHAGRRG
jgi:hypothetical protein